MTKKLVLKPQWGYNHPDSSGLHTVVELPEFIRKIGIYLNKEQRDAFIEYIATYPTKGDLIEGTGGARKIRWAKLGRGKSGGIRVVYYYHNNTMPIFLFSAYGKNERANLDKLERNVLKTIIKQLILSYMEHKDE